MLRKFFILLFLFHMSVFLHGQDSIRFSGQLSPWVNINTGNELPLWGGLRYIPQLNYILTGDKRAKIDFEISPNIYGSSGLHPFDSLSASGKIKPYRTWVRYSSEQLEIRFGLQKINFGSASILRPLMWFDQMDPRDPLQLTDGVWGLMARYYFLNNTNFWLWSLFGNNERRGWEIVPVNSKIPEFGGRIQFPVPSGEIAFSYHHRVADSRGLEELMASYEKIPENKIGFDAKWDLKTGIWFEGAYTGKSKDVGIYTNELVINAGLDYTFGIGNGMYVAMEQLLAVYDEKPFSFAEKTLFSLMTLRYPVGLFDNLSTILFYRWDGGDIYSFLNWQRQFDKIILYVMAFWNPDRFELPSLSGPQNLMAGKGIQIMLVLNH